MRRKVEGLIKSLWENADSAISSQYFERLLVDGLQGSSPSIKYFQELGKLTHRIDKEREDFDDADEAFREVAILVSVLLEGRVAQNRRDTVHRIRRGLHTVTFGEDTQIDQKIGTRLHWLRCAVQHSLHLQGLVPHDSPTPEEMHRFNRSVQEGGKEIMRKAEQAEPTFSEDHPLPKRLSSKLLPQKVWSRAFGQSEKSRSVRSEVLGVLGDALVTLHLNRAFVDNVQEYFDGLLKIGVNTKKSVNFDALRDRASAMAAMVALVARYENRTRWERSFGVLKRITEAWGSDHDFSAEFLGICEGFVNDAEEQFECGATAWDELMSARFSISHENGTPAVRIGKIKSKAGASLPPDYYVLREQFVDTVNGGFELSNEALEVSPSDYHYDAVLKGPPLEKRGENGTSPNSQFLKALRRTYKPPTNA